MCKLRMHDMNTMHCKNVLLVCFTLAMLVATLPSSVVIASTDPSDVHRKLSLELNPNCTLPKCQPPTGNQAAVNLVHITARGPADTIHYLWSTIGAPTILVVYASPRSMLTVDWTKLLDSGEPGGAVNITDERYSFAVVFNKLWEFDDQNDTARIDSVVQNSTYVRSMDLSKAMWQDFGKSVSAGKFSGLFNSTPSEFLNGTMQISLRAFAESGRHTVLPRLYYTSNSTQFDVVLDRLPPTFNHSRYAVEFQLISSYKPSEPKRQRLSVETSKSIDDEYTPGVFKILHVLSPSPPQLYGGYMEWKPVCYNKRTHTIDDSVQSQAYGTRSPPSSARLVPSIAAVYYHGRESHLLVSNMNVSYGMKEDGFYNSVNYTFWTASVGYGTPPTDSISPTLLIIIAAGVGVPVLLILAGAGYLARRRHVERRRRAGGERGPLVTDSVNNHHPHSINT